MLREGVRAVSNSQCFLTLPDTNRGGGAASRCSSKLAARLAQAFTSQPAAVIHFARCSSDVVMTAGTALR